MKKIINSSITSLACLLLGIVLTTSCATRDYTQDIRDDVYFGECDCYLDGEIIQPVGTSKIMVSFDPGANSSRLDIHGNLSDVPQWLSDDSDKWGFGISPLLNVIKEDNKVFNFNESVTLTLAAFVYDNVIDEKEEMTSRLEEEAKIVGRIAPGNNTCNVTISWTTGGKSHELKLVGKDN